MSLCREEDIYQIKSNLKTIDRPQVQTLSNFEDNADAGHTSTKHSVLEDRANDKRPLRTQARGGVTLELELTTEVP